MLEMIVGLGNYISDGFYHPSSSGDNVIEGPKEWNVLSRQEDDQDNYIPSSGENIDDVNQQKDHHQRDRNSPRLLVAEIGYYIQQ